MKKWIAAMMVCLVALGCLGGGAVYAQGADLAEPAEPIVPQYELASRAYATLDFSSNGTATCTGKIRANEATSRVNLTLKLYKKSGGAWNLVRSWNTLNNLGQASLSRTQSVTPGAYKVTVTGTVKTSAGQTERVSKSSPVKTFQ